MDASTLKLLAEIVALIVSPTVMVAAIRAIIVLGQWSQSLKSFAEFVDSATEKLDDHNKRLGRIEGVMDGAGFPTYDRRAAP